VWSIAFEIPITHQPLLTNWPKPTSKVRYNTSFGPSKAVRIVYQFEYGPQSWHEAQRIASIKVQMQQSIPVIKFVEDHSINSDSDIGELWTISGLGEYFNKFIKFPTPLYPQSKDEFMSALAKYAKKLYYGHLFFFESVFAMAIHFNECCFDSAYSRKEIQAKALWVMGLDQEGWKEKLSEKDLKIALITGGKNRGRKISIEAEVRRILVKGLLPKYRKNNGSYDVNAIATIACCSRRTVYSIINALNIDDNIGNSHLKIIEKEII